MSSSTPMPRPDGSTRRLLAALALLFLPSLASAHTSLRRSDPAKGSRLAVVPTRIGLWFTARPQLPFSRIRLVGPGGDVPLGPIAADTGNALRADITRPLTPGSYRVEWQTASADGHPIRGEFAFIVLAPSDTTGLGAPSSRDSATAPPLAVASDSADAGVSSSENHGVRWMEFIALLTMLGALGFRHGVLPPLAVRGVATADAADRARRLGQSAVILYVIAAVIRLYSESVALNGEAVALAPKVLAPMLTHTIWGIGWMIGVAGALILSMGWAVSRKSAVGTPLALTGAIGLVLAPALAGHAAASRHFIFSVTLDMLHVAAAGVWLGGLLMVLIAGIPAMRRLTAAAGDGKQDAAVSALVSSFHPLALFCAPIVVAAGLGTSWIRLGGFDALWSTDYGNMLLRKLFFFALVAAMGTFNALRARRRLGSAEGTRRFRMTGATELLFAAVVLLITAYLVATPVPGEMAVLP